MKQDISDLDHLEDYSIREVLKALARELGGYLKYSGHLHLEFKAGDTVYSVDNLGNVEKVDEQ